MNIIEAKNKLSLIAKGRYNVVDEKMIEFPANIIHRQFEVFIEGYGQGIGNTWNESFDDMHRVAHNKLDKEIEGTPV